MNSRLFSSFFIPTSTSSSYCILSIHFHFPLCSPSKLFQSNIIGLSFLCIVPFLLSLLFYLSFSLYTFLIYSCLTDWLEPLLNQLPFPLKLSPSPITVMHWLHLLPCPIQLIKLLKEIMNWLVTRVPIYTPIFT